MKRHLTLQGSSFFFSFHLNSLEGVFLSLPCPNLFSTPSGHPTSEESVRATCLWAISLVRMKAHSPGNSLPSAQAHNILSTWSSSIFSVNLDICAVWDFDTLRWWLHMIATCQPKDNMNTYKPYPQYTKAYGEPIHLLVCNLINNNFLCNVTIFSFLIQLLPQNPRKLNKQVSDDTIKANQRGKVLRNLCSTPNSNNMNNSNSL